MELNVILANKRNASDFLEKEYHVYFLLDEEKVVYVGKSNNYANRIHIHYRDKKFDSFTTFKCKSEEEMSDLEFRMICKYKPKYNKTLPTLDKYPSINKLKERYNLNAWDFKRFVKHNEIEPLIVFCGTAYYDINDFDELEVK